MAVKTQEPILHVKGSRKCTPGCFTDPRFQVTYGPEIQNGIWVWDWAWSNKFLAPVYFHYTCTNSIIQTHPSPYFHAMNFVHAITPTPITYERDGTHEYVPRLGLWNKKHTICRGVQRIWCIMTRVRRKNQEFGLETKTRGTHIGYNPVAHFYISSL